MRIGIILDSQFPPDQRVENEAVTLLNAGHEVFLYCLDYSKKLPKSEYFKGIKIIRNQFSDFIYKFSALAYTFPVYHFILSRSIAKFIKTYQIEIIHVHDIQISRAVFWANKKKKLRIILDLHENRPEIMKFYNHVNTLTGKLFINIKVWKRFEKKSIQKSTKTIVVTEEAKKYYVKNYFINPDKLVVVPNTVPKDFYTKFSINNTIINKFKNTYNILYIGDTGLRRGLLTVLEALKLLIPKISDIKIIIVGKSKTDRILKNFVIKNKLENYVCFMGWQEPSNFQSFISVSNICISPLHKNIHHDTTYANKIFQYMAFGKPLIVSNSIAQKNIVEKANSGLIFKDRDYIDFSKKVLNLFLNKNLAYELGQNGKQFIQNHFYWEKTSVKLVGLYENLS